MEEKLKRLHGEKDRFSNDFLKIRKQLQKDIALDERQLRFMTDESNKTLQYLENLLNKGQQMTQLAQTCKKYENEKESLIRYIPTIASKHYETFVEIKPDLNTFLITTTSSSDSSLSEQSLIDGN